MVAESAGLNFDCLLILFVVISVGSFFPDYLGSEMYLNSDGESFFFPFYFF